MNVDELKKKLLQYLNLQEVYIVIDCNYYKIIAIGEIFAGKSKVEQHKMVYAPIARYIADNKIHSVSVYAFCPKEWDLCNKFYKMK